MGVRGHIYHFLGESGSSCAWPAPLPLLNAFFDTSRCETSIGGTLEVGGGGYPPQFFNLPPMGPLYWEGPYGGERPYIPLFGEKWVWLCVASTPTTSKCIFRYISMRDVDWWYFGGRGWWLPPSIFQSPPYIFAKNQIFDPPNIKDPLVGE